MRIILDGLSEKCQSVLEPVEKLHCIGGRNNPPMDWIGLGGLELKIRCSFDSIAVFENMVGRVNGVGCLTLL